MTEILERPAIELGSTSPRGSAARPVGRRALLAAPAGIVLFLLASLVGGQPPAADAPAQEVVAFYDGDGLLLVLSFVALAGALLLGVAGAAFSAVLRAAGDTSPWPRLVTIGAAVAAFGVALTANFVLVLAEPDGLDPGAVQAINALSASLFMPLLAGVALLLGGVAASARRTGLLPAWATGLGIALACVAPFGPAGFATYVAGAVWLCAAAVVLARRA